MKRSSLKGTTPESPAKIVSFEGVTFPTVSHLQWLVLATVACENRTGEEIRGLLQQAGQDMKGPKFYQLMARMREAGLVLESKEIRVEGSQTIKESRYKISKAGERAYWIAANFYAQISARQ